MATTTNRKVIATRTVKPICMYPVTYQLLKVKALPLDRWMEDTDELIEEGRYVERQGYPQLGNGWFYGLEQDMHGNLIKSSWFQVNGTAFTRPGDEMVGDFKYCLSQFNHKPLRPIERKCLETLKKERLTSKSQNDLLYTDYQWHDIRETYRSSYYFTRKALKEWTQQQTSKNS